MLLTDYTVLKIKSARSATNSAILLVKALALIIVSAVKPLKTVIFAFRNVPQINMRRTEFASPVMSTALMDVLVLTIYWVQMVVYPVVKLLSTIQLLHAYIEMKCARMASSNT